MILWSDELRLNTLYNINTFYTNCRLKVDPDSNPSVDDILMPNEHEKISFCFKSNKVLQNNDGKNVASVKKCNTYYPKVLPSKWIGLFSFSFNCLMSRLKNKINDFKLDPTSAICLMLHRYLLICF